MKRILLPTLILLLRLAVPAEAAVTPASLFTNHAVLQQGKPVPVWGRGEPGESVTVTYDGQSKKATADAEGAWMVRLDPMPAGRCGELIIAGSDTHRFTDVVTGEVWLASGQSNMALQLKNCNVAPDIAAADYPDVRAFNVVLHNAVVPQDRVRGAWIPASPRTAGSYSAVAYYFAVALHKALGVPVGVINSSKGSTPIEAWMSAEALQASGLGQTVDKRWETIRQNYPQRMVDYETKRLPQWEKDREAAKAAGKPDLPKPSPPMGAADDFRTPKGLYGGMIHPLVPYAIQGAIWYQGEANASKAAEYRALFGAMVADWRRRWGQGDFPFLFVQLPNYELPQRHDPSRQMWANFRHVQETCLEIPASGMAVTYDIGNPDDVHPKNKRDVGDRLARIARRDVYGQSVVVSGPVVSAVARDGDAVVVTFTCTGQALDTRGGQPAGGFELAGADGTFHPATVTLHGTTARVASPDVAKPTAVRYAWQNNPVDATLSDASGLPAVPFSADVTP